MAVLTGFNDVTSGERASKGFYFHGGRCGYMVTGVLNTVPNWNLEFLPPGATSWQQMNSSADQINSTKAYDSKGFLPSGKYRLHCDSTLETDFSPVKLFWCYIPGTMRDAALF